MNQTAKAYWKKHLRLLAVLLVVWFIVSFVFGILLVDELNAFRLGGFKLGFWFAQQGSQYVFIILIFIYVFRMNRLDREFGFQEDGPEEKKEVPEA
ncbi:MAG: DUF4212 domain-containing protein [Bacteroidetes bacterium]|jgi:putative solute:sodium symporter small subunit|nr:DUF4212 domain-containing protein [Bacteroidota bacterium]